MAKIIEYKSDQAEVAEDDKIIVITETMDVSKEISFKEFDQDIANMQAHKVNILAEADALQVKIDARIAEKAECVAELK